MNPSLSDRFWKIARAPFKKPVELEDDLHYAAITGKLWRARCLLTEYKVNARSSDDRALRWAARSGHANMVSLLLDFGADINAKDGEPLVWALTFGREDVAKVLIRRGADLGRSGFAAVYLAAEKKDYTLLTQMLDTGQNLRKPLQKLLERAQEINDAEAGGFYALALARYAKPGNPADPGMG